MLFGNNRRVASIWFPRLQANRLSRADPARLTSPFAVIAGQGGAMRIVSLNRQASAAGLCQGMALADAFAVLPDLLTVTADPPGDAFFLRSLHRWAGQFSPSVSIEDAGLVLDISGCAHLFGGETALLEALAESLDGFGLEARLAIAGTRGAAWAISHYGRTGAVIPAGQEKQALSTLPVVALRVDPETGNSLARLGFPCIGDLYELPRKSLVRRFGKHLLQRLDQALGVEAEPIAPRQNEPSYSARLTLPEPIGLTRDVMAGAGRVIAPVFARLARSGQGARSLGLHLRRVDGEWLKIGIGFARPSHDTAMALKLLEKPVDEADAGFGIDLIRIEARQIEPLHPVQREMTQTADPGDQLDQLINALGNRLGFDRVRRFTPEDSHIPEASFATVPAGSVISTRSWDHPAPPRPLTLIPAEPVEPLGCGRPPDRFHWRGRLYEITKAQGPERIGREWWRPSPHWQGNVRDYWRIVCRDGQRLWLFTTPAGEEAWCICGVFP